MQAGRARGQGGEIEAIVSIGKTTDLIAGYGHTDARIAAGTNAGARIASVPLHLAPPLGEAAAMLARS